MNETQIGRLMDYLFSIDKGLKELNEKLDMLMVHPLKRLDGDKNKYEVDGENAQIRVEVVNEVEVTGSVHTYQSR